MYDVHGPRKRRRRKRGDVLYKLRLDSVKVIMFDLLKEYIKRVVKERVYF